MKPAPPVTRACMAPNPRALSRTLRERRAPPRGRRALPHDRQHTLARICVAEQRRSPAPRARRRHRAGTGLPRARARRGRRCARRRRGRPRPSPPTRPAGGSPRSGTGRPRRPRRARSAASGRRRRAGRRSAPPFTPPGRAPPPRAPARRRRRRAAGRPPAQASTASRTPFSSLSDPAGEEDELAVRRPGVTCPRRRSARTG